ncbi:MAG: flagellar type III secretion system pore protein FliP [Planctomycetales bacterium]|nr:flagellar type III secretion system pore protein FliP [Planctomycetales bacterium]
MPDIRSCAMQSSWLQRRIVTFAALLLCAAWAAPAAAQNSPTGVLSEAPPTWATETGDEEAKTDPLDVSGFVSGGPEQWTSRQGLSSALQIMLLLTVLSLAPALLLMTTCFVRIIVVLGLLRQALGTQQLPPSQVITSIAMFMTLLLMWPVWSDVYTSAIGPYTRGEINPDTGQPFQLVAEAGQPPETWERGVQPIRRFMAQQIEVAGNSDDVWLFYQYYPKSAQLPETYDDVPLPVLLPAFLLSELKVSFLIGFQIYLPFLILDVVVASVTISMGMLMLPPVMISLPLKLMLFVLVDGWHLVVGMLLQSFMPYT